MPTKIPTGMAEFEAWSDSIIDLVGPIANRQDLKWVLAVSVLHMGETAAFVPKRYFVKRILKGAANQVVSQVVQDIKNAKQKEIEEQQAAAAVSASPPPTSAAVDSNNNQAEATAQPMQDASSDQGLQNS